MGVARTHQWKRLHHAIINIIVNFLVNYLKMEYCDCSLIPNPWNRNKTAPTDRYESPRCSADRAI